MKVLSVLSILSLAAVAASAEETRQLDAHEHGVGHLDIAIEGGRIALELHAPGADIVGFEYTATTAADRAKVDAAVATLARPLALFQLPASAGCSVVQASAALESEAAHDAHGHEDDHAEHKHDDHGHESDDHAKHKHDDHSSEDHAAHEDEPTHTEFHATYQLTCADSAAVTQITFAYFDSFPNARALEVQLVNDAGAGAFDVTRDAPVLDLRNLF